MISFLLVLALSFFQSESTINKLQNKFESVNYLQADFKQGSNSKNSLNGKFYFTQKEKYRIELNNNIIISDGKSIWNQDIKRNKVIISNLDEDPLAFSLREYIFEYPKKCTVSEEKNGNEITLIFSAEKTDLNFKTAKVLIDNNYLIKKIEVIDFGGNSFSLHFNNIVINKIFDKSIFKFNSNEKLKIIDLR